MKYVKYLIDEIREETGNKDYAIDGSGNATEGVSQDTIIGHINDALDFIASGIISNDSKLFDTTGYVDIVANQEGYTVDDNVHAGNRIRNVQYSYSGELRDYRDLPLKSDEARLTISARDPSFYIRQGTQLLLNPIPSAAGGKIRAVYPRHPNALDIRRGQIASKTATTIVLDNDSDLDSIGLAKAQHICVVDAYGEVQDYGIIVSSYDSGTRTITIPSQTINGAVGEYVVFGEYTTTHLTAKELLLENYIKSEVKMILQDRDSSIDAVRSERTLKRIYDQLIDTYAGEVDDELEIPVLDETLG